MPKPAAEPHCWRDISMTQQIPAWIKMPLIGNDLPTAKCDLIAVICNIITCEDNVSISRFYCFFLYILGNSVNCFGNIPYVCTYIILISLYCDFTSHFIILRDDQIVHEQNMQCMTGTNKSFGISKSMIFHWSQNYIFSQQIKNTGTCWFHMEFLMRCIY